MTSPERPSSSAASSSDAHGDSVSAPESAALQARTAHHFATYAQQAHAARLGMWLFLATEILLFGGLFVAYAVYRSVFPEAFHEASRHLDQALGTINTVVLITSSFAVAAAIHYARHDRRKLVLACLAVTLLLAFAFLGIKSLEYLHKFQEGALPGKYYTYSEVQLPGASLFYTLYFLTTGLHAIHVLIGISVLSWLGWRAARGDFAGGYDLPLELGGLYWHLVDIVWIFLYPLLYLIS